MKSEEMDEMVKLGIPVPSKRWFRVRVAHYTRDPRDEDKRVYHGVGTADVYCHPQDAIGKAIRQVGPAKDVDGAYNTEVEILRESSTYTGGDPGRALR